MIINMTGGGGGAALNFKVVQGLTQPGTAEENTIWVNTDQKITSWVFSAIKPNVVSVVENAGTVLGAIEGRTFTKTNNGKAAVAFVFDGNYTGPMLVSTEPDACVYSTSGDHVSTNGAEGTVVYKGKTYYYSSGSWMGGDRTSWFSHSLTVNSHADAALLLAESYESKSSEGMVCISTGTSSGVAFNALKKNGIEVYPVSVKQYVSGGWVDKDAKIYQNGEWQDLIWTSYFYKLGNEYTDITGGFSITHKNSAGNNSTQTLSKNSDSLFLNSIGAGLAGANFTVSSGKRINVSSIKKLYARIKFINNSATIFYMALAESQAVFGYEAPIKAITNQSFDGVLSLDVSNLSGEYYLLLALSGDAITNNGNCLVYEVYGE